MLAQILQRFLWLMSDIHLQHSDKFVQQGYEILGSVIILKMMYRILKYFIMKPQLAKIVISLESIGNNCREYLQEPFGVRH